MEELYKTILKKGNTEKAIVMPFDGSIWYKWFKLYSENNNGLALKAMRRVISKGTIAHCEKINFDKGNSILHNFQDKTDAINLPKIICQKFPTNILLYSEDCLDTELRLRKMNLNPCVLNMASNVSMGGGWLVGSGAQEESLFRRSNYYEWVSKDPPPQFGGIYSPAVTVFRDSEREGYKFLAEPRKVAFIASTAYRCPPLTEKNSLPESTFQATKNKIKCILTIALLNSHDSIVLSAFGCGAYRNPPRDIARACREVILDNESFKDCFKVIAFAIFDDHNSGHSHNPNGNFLPFSEEFNIKSS